MTHLTDADRAALRERYRQERDKRLRPDGPDQYLEPSGRFAHFLEDPWTPAGPREPVTDEVTVAIIGAGFGGLATGARLKEVGVSDVRLIDGAGDVGGVWYWNRYPGAMCDTAALVYLPLLAETGYVPSMKYTYAPEIFEHAQRIATRFGLYERALFSTQVTGITWDAAASMWEVRTDRGDRFRARYVAMGTGTINHPKLPGIPGIETFGGHCFHTSRWDYGYTGGDPSGAVMTGLADKRVGIIGTGATGIQCVPQLSRDAGELFVFQRTPSAIDERNNRPIDPAEFADAGPDWQREWLINFATLQSGGFVEPDLVQDGWTDIAKRVRDRVVEAVTAGAEFTPQLARQAYEDCDDEKMTEIRARVDAIVEDPATADALKPWYRQLCKRPCFHDEYLQAYNRPNTHLVDTDGKGVERIDETGVWVGGVHHELDCLVLASGFDVGIDYVRESAFPVVGRDGETLADHWAEGMSSLHGCQVHGFPNLFLIGYSQAANLISNVTHNLTEAGTTIAAVIAHGRSVGATEIEATAEAEAAWLARLDVNGSSVFGDPDCTPGYYNNEGGEIGPVQRRYGARFPEGPVGFFSHIEAWRSSGEFTGVEFR